MNLFGEDTSQAAPVRYHWQLSESNERYTPPLIVDIARFTFEGNVIDLDPASNELANMWIGAERYFTQEDDGLARDWSGRVWVNPPYGKMEGTNLSNVDIWARKSTQELKHGRVRELAFLCGARHMGLEGVQGLIAGAPIPSAVCFLKDRIKFFRIPENKIGSAEDAGELEVMPSPTFNNVLFYLGDNTGEFIRRASVHGAVMISSDFVRHPSSYISTRDQYRDRARLISVFENQPTLSMKGLEL